MPNLPFGHAELCFDPATRWWYTVELRDGERTGGWAWYGPASPVYCLVNQCALPADTTPTAPPAALVPQEVPPCAA